MQLGKRSKGDSFCVIMLTTDFGSSQADHQIYTKVGICVVGVRTDRILREGPEKRK